MKNYEDMITDLQLDNEDLRAQAKHWKDKNKVLERTIRLLEERIQQIYKPNVIIGKSIPEQIDDLEKELEDDKFADETSGEYTRRIKFAKKLGDMMGGKNEKND